MSAGRCPHCRRAVLWCSTAAGKNIPLDPRTDPAGVYVPLKGRAWLPSELAVKGEPWASFAEAGAHTVHIRTCPSWPRPDPKPARGSGQGHLACMACGVVEARVRHYGDLDLCRDCCASQPGANHEPAPRPARSRPVRTARSVVVDQKHARDLARLEADYRAGRAHAWPDRITAALDAQGLYGPSVDRACLAEEPAVDQWEAGEAAPSWEQLAALSELTGCTVEFFTRGARPVLGPIFLCGANTFEVIPAREPVPPWRPPAVVVGLPHSDGALW